MHATLWIIRNTDFTPINHVTIRTICNIYHPGKQIFSGTQNAKLISMSSGNRRIIALAVWGDLIAPVFDSARTVLIADIEDGEISSTRTENLGPELPYSRASRLSEWGVEVVICGAISTDFARMLEMSGIEVTGFVSGNAHQVLEAYLRRMPISHTFGMPGCKGRGRRRRFRGGRASRP